MKLSRNARVFRPGRSAVWPKGHNPINRPECMYCTCGNWASAALKSEDRWEEFEQHASEKRKK